jgi:phosphatidylglycerophosphatase A
VVKKFLVTLGGVGYLPASGTFASLLTCLLLWPMILWAAPRTALQAVIAAIGAIVFSWLNVALAPWAIAKFGDTDPGQFVLDEAAGICVTVLFLPLHDPWEAGIALFMAFVAFRLFDIIKPPPCRQLEHLPAGWGILLDDLMAGVYANIVCQILLRVVMHG